MGNEARGDNDPIPVADPTRPGKQMHDPLEGDEVSGLEQPNEDDKTQESDGEVGGRLRDDEGEEVDDGNRTVDEGEEASKDSEDEEGAPI